MNLFEWQNKQSETFREDLKAQIREGFDVQTHFFFTEAQIEEIKEEIAIEDFCEIVSFNEEVDLDIELLEDINTPQDILEFVPDELGENIDLEIEVDLSLYEMDFIKLGQIRDNLFAEDYDFEVDESSNRAKIVFKRSKGNVTKRKTCGPKMRLVGNRCLPQTGTQKSKERRKGIRLKRAKKASGAGVKKRAAIKAKITKRRVQGRSRNLSGTTN